MSDPTPEHEDEATGTAPPRSGCDKPCRQEETQATMAPSRNHSFSSRSTPGRPYLPETRAKALSPHALSLDRLHEEQVLPHEEVRDADEAVEKNMQRNMH